jgi:hypothetical protein
VGLEGFEQPLHGLDRKLHFPGQVAQTQPLGLGGQDFNHPERPVHRLNQSGFFFVLYHFLY